MPSKQESRDNYLNNRIILRETDGQISVNAFSYTAIRSGIKPAHAIKDRLLQLGVTRSDTFMVLNVLTINDSAIVSIDIRNWISDITQPQ